MYARETFLIANTSIWYLFISLGITEFCLSIRPEHAGRKLIGKRNTCSIWSRGYP